MVNNKAYQLYDDLSTQLKHIYNETMADSETNWRTEVFSLHTERLKTSVLSEV